MNDTKDNQVYAGIDIGGTNVKFGLFNNKGKVLWKDQKPTLAEKGADPLLHMVGNIAESLLYHAAEDDLEIHWVGVGTPGAVNSNNGVVVGISPNIVGWQGIQLGEKLRERLNLPVWVDNDVNCMALAESKFGAGIGYKAIVSIAVGTGVGGGIVIDGKVWQGSNHSAGEIGHIPIDLSGVECRCGRIGCLETFCSSGAIINRAKKRLNKEMTPIFNELLDGDIENINIKKLFTAARKKDIAATEIIDETAIYLAIGLTTVVNLLDPEIVIIGGGVAEGGGGLIDAVTAELRKRCFPTVAENLKVVKATLGNSAGFIGAGLLGEGR